MFRSEKIYSFLYPKHYFAGFFSQFSIFYNTVNLLNGYCLSKMMANT